MRIGLIQITQETSSFNPTLTTLAVTTNYSKHPHQTSNLNRQSATRPLTAAQGGRSCVPWTVTGPVSLTVTTPRLPPTLSRLSPQT